MYKKLAGAFAALSILIMPAIASAHVVVTPKQANVAQQLLFSVSVPNEEQSEVNSLKLDIPNGVSDVMPTAKPGWAITTTDNGNAKDPAVTSIAWSGGTISAGQRDDFTFSAQAPNKAGAINWKAYQSYADGTVVHWDQKPSGNDDSSGNSGPYSVTSVVDDLKSAPKKTTTSASNGNSSLAFSLSTLAFIFSIIAFTSVNISDKTKPSKK